ncbi:MAG TPA: uroporphyrinogen decarboxylase family protein [Armatimonadota bacterium]|jgi:uroporphyrinogen decarboxylase
MTHRERLLATLRFQPVDRVPDYEFGAWEQTIVRWHEEGLPEECKGVWGAINQHFHTDDVEYGPGPWVNVGLLPGFEYKVLEEKGDHVVVQDGDGAIAEMLRPELGASIPRYLRHGLETREDWERIRDHQLDPNTPGRVPDNLEELCKLTYAAEYPIGISGGSLYGWLRNWMGVERLSIAVLEQPDWVEEMMEHLTLLMLRTYERLAGRCRIDLSHWWEDMCYNHGPLLSPKHFSRLMVPRYRRATEFLRRECGCKFNMLDCDGNIHALVPLWLEGGINVMFPLEAAHTDAYRISDEFGTRMPLRGYFDKLALIEGPKAIDAEFERLTPLLKRGGFIPHTDHLVPPDVSWDSYQYYRQRKVEWMGKC